MAGAVRGQSAGVVFVTELRSRICRQEPIASKIPARVVLLKWNVLPELRGHWALKI
jgi:hypothetical protein